MNGCVLNFKLTFRSRHLRPAGEIGSVKQRRSAQGSQKDIFELGFSAVHLQSDVAELQRLGGFVAKNENRFTIE